MGIHCHSLATSGEEAIKEIAENNPNFIMMGIMLKGAVDGIETLKKYM